MSHSRPPGNPARLCALCIALEGHGRDGVVDAGQTITALLPLQPDSEVAEAGRCLEVFFEGWLKEIYPEKRFAQPRQEDSDSEEVSSESGCSTPQGFPWPHYVQEGIQPKRRRRHMVKGCCQPAGRLGGGLARQEAPKQPVGSSPKRSCSGGTENGQKEPLFPTLQSNRKSGQYGAHQVSLPLRLETQRGGCTCPGSPSKLAAESG